MPRITGINYGGSWKADEKVQECGTGLRRYAQTREKIYDKEKK
jgi:hypothetical protein